MDLACPAGVRDFLDEADADGAALAIITSTASGAENIAVATSAALGDARTQKWPFFDCHQQPGQRGRDGDEADGSGSTSLHQSLHKRQAQVGVHSHQLGALLCLAACQAHEVLAALAGMVDPEGVWYWIPFTHVT